MFSYEISLERDPYLLNILKSFKDRISLVSILFVCLFEPGVSMSNGKSRDGEEEHFPKFHRDHTRTRGSVSQ